MKILGFLMLMAPLIAIFIIIAWEFGAPAAFGIFGIAIGLLFWSSVATYLLLFS